MKPERISRTVIYQSPWFNLYVDEVQFPSGRVVERHHLLDFERPSVVAVVENGRGDVLLVRVCRYTTGSTDWELPAGGVEGNESIIEAAQREVLEETGYHTTDCEQAYSYYPMNGITNKLAYVVHCRATEHLGERDTDEISEVRWFSKEEIWQMIGERQMTDGFSLVACLICLR